MILNEIRDNLYIMSFNFNFFRVKGLRRESCVSRMITMGHWYVRNYRTRREHIKQHSRLQLNPLSPKEHECRALQNIFIMFSHTHFLHLATLLFLQILCVSILNTLCKMLYWSVANPDWYKQDSNILNYCKSSVYYVHLCRTR